MSSKRNHTPPGPTTSPGPGYRVPRVSSPTRGYLGRHRGRATRRPPSFVPFWAGALPARALRYGYSIHIYRQGDDTM